MDSAETCKNACLSLLAAESEAAVSRIVSDPGGPFARGKWLPLDGRETNFNVISNLASDGGGALSGLMANMVDAVLVKRVRETGIDPKGEDAPRSMGDAVDTHIKDLHGGRLSLLGREHDGWLKGFAGKNLVIGVTGARTAKEGLPCYTLVDNGEGQHPVDFAGTFLSLSSGNRKGIPFVHGKHSMESAGVLQYCGRNWHKLIVSRRHDGTGGWGWTLVRRRPAPPDEMPVAEYFALSDGMVPSFPPCEIRPFKTGSGEAYEGVRLETGTVVRLYDYLLGGPSSSFRGTREAICENMTETILPFRLLDFRQTPCTEEGSRRAEARHGDRADGINPRPYYGMERLLLREHREASLVPVGDAEGAAHIARIEDGDLGEISIRAIVLKKMPTWFDTSWRNNRVFHTVNGRVLFKQDREHLAQHCKFPGLTDRIVIIVDATKMRPFAHHEVWMGDRERISRTGLGKKYLDAVTRELMRSRVLSEAAIGNRGPRSPERRMGKLRRPVPIADRRRPG